VIYLTPIYGHNCDIHTPRVGNSGRQMNANPQTKPTDLVCESAGQLLLSTSTVAIHYYYSTPQSLHWFYRPTKGGTLSRPRHYSKGARPVPRDGHPNCHTATLVLVPGASCNLSPVYNACRAIIPRREWPPLDTKLTTSPTL